MDKKHIYIFYGPPRSGKSDLSKLIDLDIYTDVIDDFIVSNQRNEIIQDLNARINPFTIIKNLIIITNSKLIDIGILVKELNSSEDYKDFVISLVEFGRGDVFL